jgi:hypothetical protein
MRSVDVEFWDGEGAQVYRRTGFNLNCSVIMVTNARDIRDVFSGALLDDFF